MRTPLLLSILLLTACASAPTGSPAPAEEETPSVAKEIPMEDTIVIEDYAILGNADAPVTLVEYSDYQCPFCKKFTTEVLPTIKENYIDTGIVRLVFKDYPLHIHTEAIEAAVATHCAGQQGAYYPYHDLLFERSRDISLDTFDLWAEELDLDTEAFNSCRADESVEEQVMASIAEAKRNGVVGTPSFLLNGRYIAGAQPYSYFERAIKKALNEEVEQPEEVDGAVCSDDAACGEGRSFPPYCSRTVATDVCVTSATPVCTYPGTAESACVTMIKEECTPCAAGEVCQEGVCSDNNAS